MAAGGRCGGASAGTCHQHLNAACRCLQRNRRPAGTTTRKRKKLGKCLCSTRSFPDTRARTQAQSEQTIYPPKDLWRQAAHLALRLQPPAETRWTFLMVRQGTKTKRAPRGGVNTQLGRRDVGAPCDIKQGLFYQNCISEQNKAEGGKEPTVGLFTLAAMRVQPGCGDALTFKNASGVHLHNTGPLVLFFLLY